jgi:hypothetical protein
MRKANPGVMRKVIRKHSHNLRPKLNQSRKLSQSLNLSRNLKPKRKAAKKDANPESKLPPSLFYFARGYVETSYGGQAMLNTREMVSG